MSGPPILEQDDCKVSEPGGRRESWLAGARTAGWEPPFQACAFSPALTRVAYTSPSPGWRSVWMSPSQLRCFM